MSRMHVDQVAVDEATVRRLLVAQFPGWADLAVQRWDSGGTTNAIFRLGTGLAVRLPLTAGGVDGLHREARWLPVLDAATSVPLPQVEALGAPGQGYPWDWAVHRWIEGDPMVEGRLSNPHRVARELGAFARTMSDVDVAGAPMAHRGGTLADQDAETRDAIATLADTDEPFDADAATAAWETALAAPSLATPPRWIHSDLMPSNLLTDGRGLAAVIDVSTVGLGDPAVDLIPAWNLLHAPAREVFRDAADADDDAWTRGRGWALSMALIQLPYYRGTNSVIAANARFVLRQVLNA